MNTQALTIPMSSNYRHVETATQTKPQALDPDFTADSYLHMQTEERRKTRKVEESSRSSKLAISIEEKSAFKIHP
jgi:hypothetical protein